MDKRDRPNGLRRAISALLLLNVSVLVLIIGQTYGDGSRQTDHARSNPLATVQVYPGDTDNSGRVDEFDILPLALYWELTGPARDSTSYDWAPMNATTWTPIEATYADANGDSVVNEFDLFPIGFNWGKSHGTTSRIGAEILKEDSEMMELISLNLSKLRDKVCLFNQPHLNRILELAANRLHGVEKASISDPYPNPFNNTVTIDYHLASGAPVRIGIYDILGRLVRNLSDSRESAGDHVLSWSGDDDRGEALPSGVYFLRLRIDSTVFTRKVVLIR